MGFVGSDLWKVRQKWGQGLLFWPGITAIVMNAEGKVWMGRRADNDQWSLVGGYYELGDDAEGCLRREVREELGLEVNEFTMFGVMTNPKIVTIKYPNGDEVQSPSHVFIAKVDGNAHDDDEHTAHEWVSVEEAEQRVGNGLRFSSNALRMYREWLKTKEFQIA